MTLSLDALARPLEGERRDLGSLEIRAMRSIDARMPNEQFGRGKVAKPPLPVTEQGQLTREALREHAAELFASFGVGAVGLSRVADFAHIGSAAARRHYATRADLLADVLEHHVFGLFDRVMAAAEAAEPGAARLEAVVFAWLDHLAREPHAHRAFLTSVHLAEQAWRAMLLGRELFLLNTVVDAVAEAVPGLAERPEVRPPLVKTAQTLLCDPAIWPHPPSAQERRNDARRLTGLLLAAAQAELAGEWPGVGPTAAPPISPRSVESTQARSQFKELLDDVRAGQEVIITRHGHGIAKLIAVR